MADWKASWKGMNAEKKRLASGVKSVEFVFEAGGTSNQTQLRTPVADIPAFKCAKL